jgi:hypothetical protein
MGIILPCLPMASMFWYWTPEPNHRFGPHRKSSQEKCCAMSASRINGSRLDCRAWRVCRALASGVARGLRPKSMAEFDFQAKKFFLRQHGRILCMHGWAMWNLRRYKRGDRKRDDGMRHRGRRPGSRPELITAAELASFAYCPEQWRLEYGLELLPANKAVLDAGTRHHARKALAEHIAGCLGIVGGVLMLLAVLVLLWVLLR